MLSNEYKNNTTKLKYLCPNGHKHHITLKKWNIGQRCGYCNGKKRLSIDYIKSEFKKEGFDLLTFTYNNSDSNLKFKCPNGHIHNTTWRNWSKGNRCPFCSGKAKKKIEAVIYSLSNDGYVFLSDSYVNSDTKFSYLCPNGHYHETTWSMWRNGFRCPHCSGKAKLNLQNIKDIISKDGYQCLTKEYINNHQLLDLKCPNGHIYKVSYANWRSKGYRCTKCSMHGTSLEEQELLMFIKSIYNGEVLHNVRYIIPPKELDIVIPSLKIAIEYCGNFWHSERMGKGKYYHLEKHQLCSKAGYQLITIFEDEWVLKNDIVKHKLLSYINPVLLHVVQSKDCIVRKINSEVAKYFCNDNHLYDYTYNNVVNIGAFCKGNLIAIMVFSNILISRDLWELCLICSKIGYNTIGVFSVLLKYFYCNYKCSELFSIVDNRWYLGNLYEELGFIFSASIPPYGWYLTDSCARRINSFYKSNKIYNRIWDCGSLKYVRRGVNK